MLQIRTLLPLPAEIVIHAQISDHKRWFLNARFRPLKFTNPVVLTTNNNGYEIALGPPETYDL